jgi:hypothetical protein
MPALIRYTATVKVEIQVSAASYSDVARSVEQKLAELKPDPLTADYPRITGIEVTELHTDIRGGIR